MSDWLKNFFAKAWGGILAALAVLFFFWQERKVSDAEVKVDLADSDKKDALLEQQENNIKQQEAEVQQANEAAKTETLTPDELAKELNKL